MKTFGLAFVLAAVLATPSYAEDAVGEWLVKDGTAKIKVEPCKTPGKPQPRQAAGARPTLCGAISWTKDPPGTDENNPDPAKRSRSVLGLPILIDMKPAQNNANRWEGEVYNAQNGKTYSASITLQSADILRIEGCVLGFLCGGEEWTRAKPEPKAPPRRGA